MITSSVPLTDEQRIRSQSQSSNIKSNTTQSTTNSLFSFPSPNQTKKVEPSKPMTFFNNLFGLSKYDNNQKAKAPSTFGSLFSKKDQNKNETKNLFINQKPENWPTWNKTPQTAEEVKPIVNQVMRDSQKVPNSAVVCRSHCLYFEYFHGDDGFTYFYMKNSANFVGYKQIFQKYQDNSKCYRNTSIIRVKTEIAKNTLQQKKRNGTYQVIRQWGYKYKAPQ